MNQLLRYFDWFRDSNAKSPLITIVLPVPTKTI